MGVLEPHEALSTALALTRVQWKIQYENIWAVSAANTVHSTQCLNDMTALSVVCIPYINKQKLASLGWVLRTTIMTPVKPQISKLETENSYQVHGFNVHVTAALLMSVC
jgi:hypothetical protein